MQRLRGPRETGAADVPKHEADPDLREQDGAAAKRQTLETDAYGSSTTDQVAGVFGNEPKPRLEPTTASPSGSAALDLARKMPCAATFGAGVTQIAAIRKDLAALDLTPVTLYRGACHEDGLKPRRLAEINSSESLAQAVGSRLMSESASISGLTGTPQVAAAFALGVQDAAPETVHLYGTSRGVVGTVKAKSLPASSFMTLLDDHGSDKTGLNTLLSVMGELKIVVSASSLVDALADRHPGILTHGFREMINAAMSREAEYLVFGAIPEFDRVAEVTKETVIETSMTGSHFSPQLLKALSQTK